MRYLFLGVIIIGIIIEIRLFISIWFHVKTKGIGNLFVINDL